MGKKALGDIMKGISEDAKTSKKYTNHCLRALTVSRLNSQNVPERHIMVIRRYRNAQLLMSYCRPTDDQERHMAAVLNTAISITASAAMLSTSTLSTAKN